MIFNVPGHIDMIRSGIKTQTRRVNRGIYQVGKDYAVQRKRGVKAEEGIRIQICGIVEESDSIGVYDAQQEGLYVPFEYEFEFRKAYPKWDEKIRWVFRFCVIGVSK